MLFIGQILVKSILQYTPPARHANIIHEAIRATPPNVRDAIQTICSLTKDEMERTKRAYRESFDASLEDDVEELNNGDERDVSCSVLLLNFDSACIRGLHFFFSSLITSVIIVFSVVYICIMFVCVLAM